MPVRNEAVICDIKGVSAGNIFARETRTFSASMPCSTTTSANPPEGGVPVGCPAILARSGALRSLKRGGSGGGESSRDSTSGPERGSAIRSLRRAISAFVMMRHTGFMRLARVLQVTDGIARHHFRSMLGSDRVGWRATDDFLRMFVVSSLCHYP